MASWPSPHLTPQKLNAFHKSDRALFTRLVMHLQRDINQSLQVMTFLFYLEKSGHRHLKNLILNLVSLPDAFINAMAEEVMMCLSCSTYKDFSTFVANSNININSLSIPLITRATTGNLTLQVIHQNRENIFLEMVKHVSIVVYEVLEDICVQAEKMHNKERKKLNNEFVYETESRNQFLNDHQATRKVDAFSKDEQLREEEDRTVFLTFSKGYPFSEEEVHDYFTWNFGEIIEAIIMLEGKRSSNLYAKMVLYSPAMIPEIVCRYKYTINGKDVWARKYYRRSSIDNL